MDDWRIITLVSNQNTNKEFGKEFLKTSKTFMTSLFL